MREAFDAIGANVLVERVGNRFEIDVRRRERPRGLSSSRYPLADTILTEVLDVKPAAAAPGAGRFGLATADQRSIPVRP